MLTVEDIARGGNEVATALGVEQFAAVIGPSLGGMTVLAYCAQFPERTRSARHDLSGRAFAPFSIALRSLQREIIRRDPAWADGNYETGAMPGDRHATGPQARHDHLPLGEGMGAALRTRTCDTPSANRGDPFGIDFEVESYLESHANKFTGQFDPNCYLYISRAMDLFDLGRPRRLRRRGVEPLQGRACAGHGRGNRSAVSNRAAAGTGRWTGARMVRDVTFSRLPSLQGHDSFLVDMDRFRPVMGDFLKRAVGARSVPIFRRRHW